MTIGDLARPNAFQLGAKSVNPSVTTTVVFTASWCDPAKNSAAANSLIDQGIDVLRTSLQLKRIPDAHYHLGVTEWLRRAPDRALAPLPLRALIERRLVQIEPQLLSRDAVPLRDDALDSLDVARDVLERLIPRHALPLPRPARPTALHRVENPLRVVDHVAADLAAEGHRAIIHAGMLRIA